MAFTLAGDEQRERRVARGGEDDRRAPRRHLEGARARRHDGVEGVEAAERRMLRLPIDDGGAVDGARRRTDRVSRGRRNVEHVHRRWQLRRHEAVEERGAPAGDAVRRVAVARHDLDPAAGDRARDLAEGGGELARIAHQQEVERLAGGDPADGTVVDGERIVDDDRRHQLAAARRVREHHVLGRARREHELAAVPALAADPRLELRVAARRGEVAHDRGHGRVGRRLKWRLLDRERRDRDVVVGRAELDVVERGQLVRCDAALLRRQIGEHRETRPGPGARLAERQLERGREARRGIERLERLQPCAELRAVARPALGDVRALGGGDQHRLVAARELVEERTSAAAGELEARAACLARLHAGGDVEDDDERRSRRRRRRVLEIWADITGDQRQQQRELEEKQRVGTKAPPLEDGGGNVSPQEQRAQRDDTTAPIEQIQDEEHGDRRERERAGGIEDAHRVSAAGRARRGREARSRAPRRRRPRRAARIPPRRARRARRARRSARRARRGSARAPAP